MNRTLKMMLVAAPLLAIGATAASDASAWPPPTPAYVAGYRPVYYNGYAHYYYGGHWFYRDGGGAWRWYDREPGYLAGVRPNWERYRVVYHR